MTEKAVSYGKTRSRVELIAALILADAELDITEDKLLTLTKAAGFADIEPIWVQLFAKALGNKDVRELVTDVSAGASAAAPVAASAAAGAAAAEAVEEKEEPAKEESDEDLGMGLFD